MFLFSTFCRWNELYTEIIRRKWLGGFKWRRTAPLRKDLKHNVHFCTLRYVRTQRKRGISLIISREKEKRSEVVSFFGHKNAGGEDGCNKNVVESGAHKTEYGFFLQRRGVGHAAAAFVRSFIGIKPMPSYSMRMFRRRLPVERSGAPIWIFSKSYTSQKTKNLCTILCTGFLDGKHPIPTGRENFSGCAPHDGAFFFTIRSA